MYSFFNILQCNTVLEIDPKNVKALYRRGTSCLKSGDTETALADFTKVIYISIGNSLNNFTLFSSV